MPKDIEIVLSKKISRILFFMLLDTVSIILAGFLALWLRFDFQQVPTAYLNTVLNWSPIDCLITIAVFVFFGLYNSIWKYASVYELISILSSCFIANILIWFYKRALLLPSVRGFWFIYTILIILFVCGSRFAYRIGRTLLHLWRNKKQLKKVMIVGGGEAARLLLDEINRNTQYNDIYVRCIIDDDKQKRGTRIRGIKIAGNHSQIQRMVERYSIDQIIIAIPSASKEQIAKIVTEAQKTKCEIRILPSIYLTMNRKSHNIVAQVRPIKYEDFLGRDQIVVNNDEITGNLVGKTILVTGGGGSIGSELCRQIAKVGPKLLIIFDIYENNAYEIQQELYRKYPELNLRTIVGSVRDYARLEKVFIEFKPDQVYHAAAHKHVPLMEYSPNEAIKNNCLGTLNTAKLADKYKASKFVLVSTDKAVRPTNIMGASKRICEMIIQEYDKHSETNFVAVRFGNVLGSNGSVIPLFLKQIENGGPITVTHKNITRYFMTIPEAVSLILQAAVYAEGGEIFVLDMGKPVRIYDLAKQIIRYKGLTPGKDIKIMVTGLRPGEKLYEEMLMKEEGLKETPNKLIHIGKPIKIKETFLKDLDGLIVAANQNDGGIKERAAGIVGTYKMQKEAGNV